MKFLFFFVFLLVNIQINTAIGANNPMTVKKFTTPPIVKTPVIEVIIINTATTITAAMNFLRMLLRS
jgi:hypothetical protein